jgi:hypothetical protein
VREKEQKALRQNEFVMIFFSGFQDFQLQTSFNGREGSNCVINQVRAFTEAYRPVSLELRSEGGAQE